MTTPPATLTELLDQSVRRFPDHIAVEEADSSTITYRQLADLSARLAGTLRSLGVSPGDRVGICVRKTIDSLVSVFGIMKSGAAYVPVDSSAPPARNAMIFSDCAVRIVIVEERLAGRLREEMKIAGHEPRFLVLPEVGGGQGIQAVLGEPAEETAAEPTGVSPDSRASHGGPSGVDANALAYILYTSGSTGRPKGVMLTHLNAMSFVDWATRLVQPTTSDRFSSHAPFHFDLSILDIYVPLGAGSTLVLIGEEIGKEPMKLAALIADKKLTVWYSTPSILSFLTQFGHLETRDLSRIRTVLFAGEVFPVRHLRKLKELLPHPGYFNLYGPTETNVCTYCEIPAAIPPERDVPFPIGPVCDHLSGRIVDDQGRDVPAKEPGELVIAGPAVTGGYWNLPERNQAAFLTDSNGRAWYRTGDIVIDPGDGNLEFVGRRDRMVKRRGYRVELGEIEAGLYKHKGIAEAAVVATPDADSGVRITAFVAFRDGTKASIIELKRFSAENLPSSMIPDVFSIQSAIPKTSTDKIDYQRLKDMVS